MANGGTKGSKIYYFSCQIMSFTQYDQLDSKSQQVEGFACGVLTTADWCQDERAVASKHILHLKQIANICQTHSRVRSLEQDFTDKLVGITVLVPTFF